mgnify:CR=1 FL=1
MRPSRRSYANVEDCKIFKKRILSLATLFVQQNRYIHNQKLRFITATNMIESSRKAVVIRSKGWKPLGCSDGTTCSSWDSATLPSLR